MEKDKTVTVVACENNNRIVIDLDLLFAAIKSEFDNEKLNIPETN